MKKKLLFFLLAIGAVLAACSSDYEILKSFEAINLTADSSSKVIGQTVTFTVKDNAGTDLTAESVIYVDGVAIEGNTFTSEVVGEFEITAKYLSVTSAPVIIDFHDGSQINFRKKVLVEDYTGTWCGYCPRVAWGIELLQQQSEDAVAVAIHRPSSNSASPVYDPYNFPAASELEDAIGLAGYPNGMLNRKTVWTTPEPDNISQAISLTQGANPKLGLAMTSAVSGNSISLDVNVMFSNNFNGLKLVVYVLENGLLYEQTNYTTYYGGVDHLVDFEHNHVLRACLTSIMGDAISSSETTSGNVYTRSFSIPVPANVANANNIEFVAFVVDEAGNALNVRKVHRDETQDFEILE